MIFKNCSLTGVTYRQIRFNKSLRNIKITDKMVYINEEKTLIEITSGSVRVKISDNPFWKEPLPFFKNLGEGV